MSVKVGEGGIVSQREFSRRMGCSDTSVRKAIKAGKISKGLRFDDNGKPCIHYDTAFKEWQASYNPEYASNDVVRTKLMATKPLPETEDDDAPPLTNDRNKPMSSLANAKTAQAVYRAKLLKVELDQKLGNLVDKKEVYMALFEAGREVKTAIMSIPDRYIDAIVSAKTRNEAHTILTRALIEALDVLSDIEQKDILTPHG